MANTDTTPAAESSTPAAPINLHDPAYYINRELSMLEFQYRVFEEAQDEANPLLNALSFWRLLAPIWMSSSWCALAA